MKPTTIFSKTILIVTDNPENQDVLSKILKNEGFRVITVNNSEQAFKNIKSNPPDLILLDVILSKTDGYTTCKILKDNTDTKDIPIIFTFSLPTTIDKVKAFEAGAADYIIKPFHAVEVISRIQTHLELYYKKKKLNETVKKRTAELKTSKESFRLLLDSTAEAIYGLDRAGICTFANRSCVQILGYNSDTEILGKNMHDLTHHSRADRSPYPVEECKIYEAFRKGESIHVDDEVLWYADGTSFPAEYWSYPIIHDDQIIGAVVTFLDITERKQAQKAILESEEKHRLIFQSSRDAIMTLAPPSWHFTSGNIATIEMFGAQDEVDFVYRAPWEYSPPSQSDGRPSDEKAKEMIEIAMREGSHSFEWQHKRINGKEFPATVLLTRFEFAGQVLLQATVRDISEQEKLKNQLLQAQKLESIGRLAGGVAHDYNNALSVIIGFTELSMDDVNPADPMRTNLDEILKAAMRATDITRQLLAFARKQTISPKVLDLNENVEGMLKMLRRLIGEDIDLAWLPGAGLWPVKIDPSQIDQILANLCVNARDAIAGVGKVTIETENITLDEAYCADQIGFVPGEFVLIALSDNGCGMEKDILDKIFEPFFTTKDVNKGTGLGLATVYGIAKQNNGFINVYSEPGQGTTIKIYFPRHEGEAVEIQKEGKVEIPQGNGETILLVEDDPSLLSLARQILDGLGYTVLIAGSPKKAINIAKDHTGGIHLLITDVIMPEMDGRELADQLLSLYPDLKQMFMSGYTANIIVHHGVLDEGMHFIQKPFSKRNLAVKVRMALSNA